MYVVYTYEFIVCSSFHFLALDQSGQVWGWGDNSRGQLATLKSERIKI
ncbi:RCC1-like domain-containing protein [Paenibacillus sp. 8b26]